MKIFIKYTFVSFLLGLFIIGCGSGVQDKPLPMSPENIQMLSKSVDFSDMNQHNWAKKTKTLLEEEMGYSFDKTLRAVVLGTNGVDVYSSYKILEAYPGWFPVHMNPKKYLEEGYIEQRTYDLLLMVNVAKPINITKGQIKFLHYVEECQNKNQGVCDRDSLYEIFYAHGEVDELNEFQRKKVPSLFSNTPEETKKYYFLEQVVPSAYKPRRLRGLLLLPDGKEFNTNFLKGRKFIVNKEKLDFIKRYNERMAEEARILSGQQKSKTVKKIEPQEKKSSSKSFTFDGKHKIIGTVDKVIYYGPPGYGEDPLNDKKLSAYILKLKNDITVTASSSDELNYTTKTNEIQLVTADFLVQLNSAFNAQKKVSIEGVFFSSHTGSHIRKLLIDVKSVKMLE